jgi:Fe-S cluster assembly protein SufD
VNTGSSFNKSNWNADLIGEGASAKIFGLVKGEGSQNFDQTVFVSHQVPHTGSNVLFKNVLRDKSRSVFTGLIHVWKTAQRTDAYQTNRNLLIGKDARADTIPKLEIEADDVKCGHAAAVSNLDEDQLYYLMSRGLNRREAQAMIIEGFYEDALGKWMEGVQASEKDKSEILNRIREILFASANGRPVGSLI